MRTTNRPTLISILCTLGILLCVFCMGKAAFDFVVDCSMKEVIPRTSPLSKPSILPMTMVITLTILCGRMTTPLTL